MYFAVVSQLFIRVQIESVNQLDSIGVFPIAGACANIPAHVLGTSNTTLAVLHGVTLGPRVSKCVVHFSSF